MRFIKLLGLILLACLALCAVLASTAWAVEPGFLFLDKEGPPVIGTSIKQKVTTTFETTGKNKWSCSEVKRQASAGKAGDTHITLGELSADFEGCKAEGVVGCASENTKGEKDAKEVVLLLGTDTDLHLVALLSGTTLVPGELAGFLELEKKLDLTLNCGGVKILVLGAVFLEIKGKELATKDAEEVEILPTTLTCDTSDTLCQAELAKWGATVGGKVCPAAMRIGEIEECATVTTSAPEKVKLTPMVLIDF